MRVLGHELNNSLAPVKSLAGSMRSLVDSKERPSDWQQDMAEGLSVIESRVDALSRFTASYTRLAKLPEPRYEPVEVSSCLRRVAKLETRLTVDVEPGPEAVVEADAVQIEQALINLVRNAADASLETGGGVRAGWRVQGAKLEIWVADEGLGLSNNANLFVPFFTTKPGGSGIGLVLSRRIAESHGGTLTLANREGAAGCVATLALPANGAGKV
ncbi:MAG: HAMP domain-containing sensor histidine kinase [Bryobacterales bacterium]